MKDAFAGDEQVVGNDPTVTPPPHGLSTHHGAALDGAQFPQSGEAELEAGAHCVICIVVKALIFPKAVDPGRNILRSPPEAAELGDMFIANFKIRQ